MKPQKRLQKRVLRIKRTQFTSFLGDKRWTAFLSSLAIMAFISQTPQTARASFSNVEQQNSGYNFWFNGVTQITSGTLNNSSTLNGTFSSLTASTGPLFGLDSYVNGGNPTLSGNYYFGVGVLAWNSNVGNNGTTTVNNNSGDTIKGIVSGSGVDLGMGIYSIQYYGSASGPDITINNSGTVDGEVQNFDGTAAGIYHYSEYGGLNVNNYSGATCSATARYYTTGIYGMSYYGPVNIVNNGTAKGTSSGGQSGSTSGYAYSVGIDIFSFDSASASPIYCQNTGSSTATTTGGNTQFCYGAFLWAEGGAMTLLNSGTISATTTSASGAGCDGVYCGGNNGPDMVVNSGSITGSAGGAGGWGLGVENDGSNPIGILNTGSISHNNGLGVALFAGTGAATITNTSSGSIYGGLTGISAQNYPGNITIYESGSLKSGGSAMILGSGNDTVYVSGLPTITGTMDGNGGNNSLNFNLTGTLQTVNGAAANSGNNLSSYGLGTSGNIVVSGQTYAWKNFNVTGSVSGSGPIANGTYKILNLNSGAALGTVSGGTTNGTPTEQWSYAGSQNQKWNVTNLGNNQYEIVNVQGGLSLDVFAKGTGNGTVIDTYSYNGGTNQKWILTAGSSGYYYISPASATGSVVDVIGASKANGTRIDLWSNNGGANQQWSFQSP